jgi:hypothetical protein
MDELIACFPQYFIKRDIILLVRRGKLAAVKPNDILEGFRNKQTI